MTENQKKLVQIYREKGMSYKEVADTLSVSINTIKTFCKRNGLGGVFLRSAPPKWQEPERNGQKETPQYNG